MTHIYIHKYKNLYPIHPESYIKTLRGKAVWRGKSEKYEK
jgi:hypothetical protein